MQTQGGPEESRAWNYTVDVVSSTTAVLDPDGLVLEARWFSRDEAARLLAELPYRPLSEPAVAFLRGEAPIGGSGPTPAEVSVAPDILGP